MNAVSLAGTRRTGRPLAEPRARATVTKGPFSDAGPTFGSLEPSTQRTQRATMRPLLGGGILTRHSGPVKGPTDTPRPMIRPMLAR